MALQARLAFLYGAGTVSTTAVGLADAPFSFSSANLLLADEAIITTTTAGVRFRIDGGTPTSSSHSIASGSTYTITGSQNIRNLKMIRDGGSDATVAVTLLKI